MWRKLIPAGLLLALSVAPAPGASPWQPIPGAPVAGRHDDICFLDLNLGWVVNSSGEVWKTTDAGDSWELQLNTVDYPRSVYFADSLTGYVGLLSGDTLIYRTTDSGATWQPVSGFDGPQPVGVCGLSGVGSTIYGVGRFTGNPVLIKSTDVGETWSSAGMDAHARNLIDCHFFDEQTGFAVGGTPGPSEESSRPVILFTDDGGATWTTRHIGSTPGEYCWKIFFVSHQIGCVSVYNSEGARVIKTTDGGLTWEEKLVPDNTNLEGVGFADASAGWVDGWGGMSATSDGGETWDLLDSGGTNINRFQMLSATEGYAAGTTIYRYEPGASGAPETPLPAPSPFALRSYPNPMTRSTVIEYVLPRADRVRIRIFDNLGRKLDTILDAHQTAGRHTVAWKGLDASGRGLRSGVYLYRVDAGGRAESGTLLLAR